MKKRIKGAALTVALIIVFSMCAGCAGNTQAENVKSTDSVSETPAQAKTNEPDEAVPDNQQTEIPGPVDTGSKDIPSENDTVSSEAPDVSQESQDSMEMIPLTGTSAMFEMPMPAATGANVLKNSKAEIDISNTRDGYVMIRYLEKTDKGLRVVIKGPSGTSYTYVLDSNGEYDVYPLSDGNGAYQIGIFENIAGDKYSIAYTDTVQVELADEFAPFLRPNQYVNYTADSEAVKKAAELTQSVGAILDKIAAVYNYVIGNITYDNELAKTVKSGYLPDIDEVLSKGKGICFDYAALMTAMLRSQGIPTKLVIGYAGDAYHAWISTYSDETGWVDGVISFDGSSWQLMDPTFASTGGNDYVGDGQNYQTKYLY